MIGAFWNVRGLNKEGRLQCLADFVKDSKLDFVGFQEMKKKKVLMSLFFLTFTRTLTGKFSLLKGQLVVLW
jgi:exonuclease III